MYGGVRNDVSKFECWTVRDKQYHDFYYCEVKSLSVLKGAAGCRREDPLRRARQVMKAND